MPEYIRALIVIIIIVGIVLMIAKPAFADFVSESDFNRRSLLWVIITMLMFLSHNIWIYCICSTIVILFKKKNEGNIVALYFMLLFVAPPVSAEVPGFGVVNFLFSIDHYRLLALIILLPASIELLKLKEGRRFGSTVADKFLIAYVVLIVVLKLRGTTVTDALRQGFYDCIDILLPYYVLSRALKNLKAFNEALAGFVIASVILAGVAIFEYTKSWLLYTSISYKLNQTFLYGNYLDRAGSLRALGTTGQPIALGFVLMVAMGFCIYLQRLNSSGKSYMRVVIAVLAGGLFASLSRGPWMGMLIFIIIYYLFSGAVNNMMKLLLGFTLTVILINVLPGGEKIINMLPFIGDVDVQNVTYRQQLFDVGLIVSSQHPWLGSVNFLKNPEMQSMVQGQGIIDLVNSYLGILLKSGWVGLSLFVGFFIAIILDLFRASQNIKVGNQAVFLLGVMLLAILISIMGTIFTVSSITVIPVVYWAVAGLASGYTQMVRRGQLEA